MADTEFEKRAFLSSVPLVRLGSDGVPDGFASGALIDYGGRRMLLTVAHATGDQKRWAIQLAYIPGKGTVNHSLGAMNFLAKASLSAPKPKLEDIDFAYVEVPGALRAYRQQIRTPENVVEAELPISIHAPTLADVPSADETFGFCGMVMPSPEKHLGHTYVFGELRTYVGLTYLRTEGDYHVFALPFAHPGHEHFRGCSGAPIMSESGAMVALVCGSPGSSGEIWGISLRAYKTPIDILVGSVS